MNQKNLKKSNRRILVLVITLVVLLVVWGGATWQAGSRADWLNRASREELEAEVKKQPNDANVQGRIGEMLVSQGELEAAVPYLQRALELDPGTEVRWTTLSLALRDHQAAFEKLEQALKAFPDSPTVHAELARRTLMTGQAEKARAMSEKNIKDYPDSYLVWEVHGQIMAAFQKQKDVEEAFQKSLALKDNAQTRLSLAATYIPLQQYDKIVPLCAPLIQQPSPLSPTPSQRALALVYHCGSRLNQPLSKSERDSILRQIEELVSQQKLLPMEKQFLPTYFLGQAMLLDNKPDLAISPLEQTVKLNPQNPGGLYLLTSAYRRSGRKQQADATQAKHKRMTQALTRIEQINIQLEKNPENADALLDMAKSLQEIDNREQAIQVYQRLISLGKHTAQAQKALETLNSHK